MGEVLLQDAGLIPAAEDPGMETVPPQEAEELMMGDPTALVADEDWIPQQEVGPVRLAIM